jgi:putative hemolysin
MREASYSRYPVYRDNDSEVIGVLEVKGLLDQIGRDPLDLFRHLREPLFVADSTQAMKLLEIFREEQQSLALVVDEYGDIQGMVTVNDLLGAVIGRLGDSEHADGGAGVVEREDGTWLVDGALPIGEFRELLGGIALPGENEHDYNTAAGMVVASFGRIPNAGESLTWHRWRIEVVDLDGARVDKLLVERLAAADDSDDGRHDVA